MSGNIVNNLGSLPVVFDRGEGATLYDADGKSYIDFVAGIGVNCLGHNHPGLTQAIEAQIKKAIHVSNYYNSAAGLEYSRALLRQTKFDKVFFGNSGAEANEAAIKFARKLGGRRAGKNAKKTIVTLRQSFHGRTITTLAATGQDKFHSGDFSPYTPGFEYISAGDYSALERAFDDGVCAFMFECVQGEGGVNVIDADWIGKACRAARSAGAIIIADEVQTGIGRTGTFLASEALDEKPDIITLAKGIAGGVPMGAALIRGDAAECIAAGDHQSTFGGNPLACAAASAVLSVVSRDGFLREVREKGDYIRQTVRSWNLPLVRDARGKGLMIGVELVNGGKTAAEIQLECLKNGLCISTAGAYILRFLPPLVVTREEIDAGLAIIKRILSK